MKSEIDELIAIDHFHRAHFGNNRPTIDEWRKRRNLYVDSAGHEDMDDVYNMEKDQWCNDLRISVYFRDHKNIDGQLDEIKHKLKVAVPGYDFDTFNLQTIHDDEQCLDGDIFSHSKAWRVSEIDKVERKFKHTEKDVNEGKIREGEKDPEEEIADVEDVGEIDDQGSFNEGEEDLNENEDVDQEDEHQNEDEIMAAEEEGNEEEDKDIGGDNEENDEVKEDL